MKTRILLILPLSGGSLIVGVHLADTLSTMKNIELNVLATQPLHDIYEKSFRHLTDEKEHQKTIIEHINLSAIGRVVDFRPDLVLVMALSPISPWFIEKSKQLDAITAHWYIENFRYYPANPLIPRWQTVAPYYDHFFTIQKGAFFEALNALNVQNYHYLPTGCNPRIHNKIEDKTAKDSAYVSDICFVGSPYPNRVKLFQALEEFDIALWGPGWSDIQEPNSFARGNGDWITSHEEAKIINGALIGLNIHSSLDSGPMVQRSDFLNPRVFTIAACGTFQLVDEQEPLHEAFEIGTETAIYYDFESLVSQLHHFLENSADREIIACNAMEKALEEHTYEKRIKNLLNIVGLT